MTIPRGPWAHRHLGEWTGAAVGDISSSGDTGLCAHRGGPSRAAHSSTKIQREGKTVTHGQEMFRVLPLCQPGDSSLAEGICPRESKESL